jgi:hypothetical protein
VHKYLNVAHLQPFFFIFRNSLEWLFTSGPAHLIYLSILLIKRHSESVRASVRGPESQVLKLRFRDLDGQDLFFMRAFVRRSPETQVLRVRS